MTILRQQHSKSLTLAPGQACDAPGTVAGFAPERHAHILLLQQAPSPEPCARRHLSAEAVEARASDAHHRRWLCWLLGVRAPPGASIADDVDGAAAHLCTIQ